MIAHDPVLRIGRNASRGEQAKFGSARELPRNAKLPDPKSSAILESELDDQTIVYALAMQPAFADLQQAAGQLAGLLVLVAAGSRAAIEHDLSLSLAREAHSRAKDAIRSACPPPRGLHHHWHLGRAEQAIEQALTRAPSAVRAGGTFDVDASLPHLSRGWHELKLSAAVLPGFELVSFDQACCAHHGGAGRL